MLLEQYRSTLDVCSKPVACSAAGIVLATGIIHVLPDAQTALSNPCLNFNSDYPWAFTLAGTPSPILHVSEDTALTSVSLVPGIDCVCVSLC